MAVERVLLQSGDFLLLQTGDRLLLQSSSGGTAYTLSGDAGSYAITGQDAAMSFSGQAQPEPGKGWPKNRRQRRAAKRLEIVAEVQQETRNDLISADVARALQAKRLKPAEAPEPAAAPDVSPEPEAPVVADSGESVRLILEAWERIELRQVEELAQAEIARIQALKDEELMIVTMIAALA